MDYQNEGIKYGKERKDEQRKERYAKKEAREHNC
jgi:hypothetical protein